MEIKTKFNHGQRVQVITYAQESYTEKCPICEGKGHIIHNDFKISCTYDGCWGHGFITKYKEKCWFVPKDDYYSFTVQKIGVELYNPNNKKVSTNRSWIYYMAGGSGTMFNENELFASIEDAEKECLKRNADESI